VLDDDTPKYLNSPETPVFHKGRELYGLYEARRHSRDLAQLIVVEGYMDVVGLAQFGVRRAVATLGTATTPDHIDRLFRLTGDVIFCFDGDNAGRKAAWRALEAALPRMTGHHQVRFMFLPEGDDPDSLVRKEGQEKFLARTVTAIPLSAFLFEHLAAQADLSSIDGRARLVELARPHLSKVPSGVFQQMLLGRLAEMVEIDPVQLSRAYGGERVAAAKSAAQAVRYRTEHVPPSAARIAVKLLLTEPALAQHVADASRISGKDPRAKLVLKMIELLRERPNMTQAMMVEFFRGTPEGAYLDKVARWNWTAPVDGLGAEFDGAIERLAAQNIDARTQELLEKARIAGLTPEEKHELKQLVAVKLPAAKAERNGTYGSH
jgi:DNA primase